MTHYATFRDQLAIAHPAFGHALWEPDPGEEYPPVEVGDVGFTRQGKFHRLFNALLPENHQSHQRFGVPEDYEPLLLSVPKHIDHGILNPNNFCSYGVTVESGGSDVHAVAPPTSDSAEVSFSCTKKDGAALSLPVVARREDTLSQAHFGRWITRHIDSWFAFSQRHGLGIDMEDIVLVTGCHRTRSWSNIAFYESRANSRVSLSVRASGNPGTTVHWRVLSQRIQGTVLSHGPSGDNLPDNQCLFIRGFRVKRILWIIPRLRGAAEPQPDLRGNDSEPAETELVRISSVPERDPLHVLLKYITKRAPNCDMALVHDDDLVQILGAGNGTSPETLRQDVVMNYLKRSKPEIGVMSESWTANNDSPRTDTEDITVAMLSERLHSLDLTAVHTNLFAGSQPAYNLTMPFSISLPWTKKEKAQRKYIDLIREASSNWASWDPPKRVWVGDFGTISKKTGEFLVEGNIYRHKDISQIAKEYTPLEAPETDQYRVHSYDVRELDVGTSFGATAHRAENLVFKTRWKFNANRGAILLMFIPRLISVPDTFLEVALLIPALRGKTLAHRVYECPGFFMYLSNKTSETVTISLRVTEPGVAVDPAVNIGWLADGCSGVRQQAYRPGAVFTPLLCLKSLRKHLLRR